MINDPTPSSKRDVLKGMGVLNPRPQEVADPLFKDSEFFDPEDLVQVKYEMLRRVRVDRKKASVAAALFGFSRVTFYQALRAFKQEGLPGLVSRRRGPRGGHKLTRGVLEYLAEVRQQEPSLGYVELAHRVLERFDLKVHPRSIERALDRGEKKTH